MKAMSQETNGNSNEGCGNIDNNEGCKAGQNSDNEPHF